MKDKDAIHILKGMMEKHSLSDEEKEAILTAIGILSWTTLMEGRINHMKKSRDEKMQDLD